MSPSDCAVILESRNGLPRFSNSSGSAAGRSRDPRSSPAVRCSGSRWPAALAPRPDVVLLDEPFSALDAGLRQRVRHEVRSLLSSLGTTSILVTHDQEEALSIADRVAIVRHGLIVQNDTPSRLYEAPADLETARFIGAVVELPATRVNDATVMSALGLIEVDVGGAMACSR